MKTAYIKRSISGLGVVKGKSLLIQSPQESVWNLKAVTKCKIKYILVLSGYSFFHINVNNLIRFRPVFRINIYPLYPENQVFMLFHGGRRKLFSLLCIITVIQLLTLIASNHCYVDHLTFLTLWGKSVEYGAPSKSVLLCLISGWDQILHTQKAACYVSAVLINFGLVGDVLVPVG